MAKVTKRNKSALKAHRQNIKRREHNRELRSKLRTGLKAIRKALDGEDREGAKNQLQGTQSLVDKMAAKGIIHRNTAARHKSRLGARVSSPAAPKAPKVARAPKAAKTAKAAKAAK